MGKIFQLLSMFGPLRAAKFWVATVMALVQFANIYAGLDIGLDQETATAVITGIGALLVWLVPNAKRNPSVTILTEAQARSLTGHQGPIEDRSR